jgi:hypothetical protein
VQNALPPRIGDMLLGLMTETRIIEYAETKETYSGYPLEVRFQTNDVNVEIRNLTRGLKFTVLADCYNGLFDITYVGIYYSVASSDSQAIYWNDIESGRYDLQQMKPTQLEEETTIVI